MQRATAHADTAARAEATPAAAIPLGPSPLERLRERGRMRHGLALLGPAFVATLTLFLLAKTFAG